MGREPASASRGRSFDLVVCDEAHHALSPGYRAVFDSLGCFQDGGPQLLGLTATPERSDNGALSEVFQGIVFQLGINSAIQRGYLVPPNMTTCWMALDETRADTGTISYVRGSHLWPRSPLGGRFHAPDDWLAHVRECQPPGVELELVPIEVPPGGIAVHDGWTFHGSAPNVRADRERRAIIAHMMAADTRWNLADPHPIYSKYRRPADGDAIDEAFYPILWRENGYRSPWVDAYTALRAA